MKIPSYIAKDTFQGKTDAAFNPRVYRVAEYTACELVAFTPEGEPLVIFESYGHVGGVERFTRTRFLADGDGNLYGYDSDGGPVIIHPADRVIRVLTGK